MGNHRLRGARIAAALLLSGGLLIAPGVGADAVGSGNPVITSPAPSVQHYNGYQGPFVTNFDNAPKGTYSYYVDKTLNGSVVPSGAATYHWDGAFPDPHLTVSPLAPGTGYVFHVTDGAGHEARLAFTVTAGPPPTCSIVLPGRVRMKSRSVLVTATLSTECKTLHTVYAVWQANKPSGGFAETFTFDHKRTDSWRIFDDEVTGTYPVRPKTARSSAGGPDVPQNSTRITMRMDSRFTLSGQRSGSLVLLTSTLTRYSHTANHYVAWSHRNVVVSYRPCPTCGWRLLTRKATNGNGVITLKIRSGSARQYRLTAAGTATTWAPHAAMISR